MDIKSTIAKNIAALRKHNKMTQLELAEKVNYSDKAISRWESGEVTPDIETLQKLSITFNVPLPKLFEENFNIVQTEKEYKQKKINKLIICLLAMSFIWTMATIIYVYSFIIDNKYNWQIFVYSFPATFLVGLVFNSVWGKPKFNYICTSALIWSILVSFFIGFLSYKMWPIFILGAPLQIVIILWSKLRN